MAPSLKIKEIALGMRKVYLYPFHIRTSAEVPGKKWHGCMTPAVLGENRNGYLPYRGTRKKRNGFYPCCIGEKVKWLHNPKPRGLQHGHEENGRLNLNSTG